ncbi:MAG TPA: hypothetical protein VGY98_17250, partial [Verrucomicrobiae bacterium]|nr:hypothetical protein [Verrucomicrobiae bacterium]
GGTFQYTWDEPVVYDGAKDPEFVFKFEADGYAPFITRVIHASEGDVRFDLRLTPAPSTEVTVLSPDNEPAANVDIGLASPGARLSLVPGGFYRENIQSGGTLLMTDSAGHFTLPSDQTIKRVIAASPQGYAEATLADLAANPVMQLQPWGQVEGTFAVDGQPSAGRVVSIGFGQDERFDMISCDSTAFKTTTDDQGRFTIPVAPPGDHEMVIMDYFTNQFGLSWTSQPLQPVNISSGTDTVITIDTPPNPGLTPAMLKKYGVKSN